MKTSIFGHLIRWYFTRRMLPYWCILIIDMMIVLISVMFTYLVFNSSGVMFEKRIYVLTTAILYAVLSLVGAKYFRTYSGIMRYSSFVDLLKVAYANGVSLLLALVVSWITNIMGLEMLSALSMEQTVVAFVVSTLVMCFERIAAKSLHDEAASDSHALRVLIYEALAGGIGLAKYIRSQNPRRYILGGFLSDDPNARHIQLMGEKVYYVEDDIDKVIKEGQIDAVLVNSPCIETFRENQKLQDSLMRLGVKILLARSAKEANLKNGELTSNDFQMKEVSVEDLLPRSEIKVDMDSVGAMLKDKCVMITGSAGSIGLEMVRQIAVYKPSAMILIDQAETPQHDVMLMTAQYPDIQTEVIVTSICHGRRMDGIFRKFRPDYVFHAAAYKHVPMMENNPSEAVLNNIHGTKVLADLSVKYGVKKFVMVSTDKAVNPTNVMGCSKRICEIYVQSLNNYQATTQFVTTRFGNVLGSNGSVIPLFREQIKNGGPVMVTDERIVRYFMLIPEACKLVLEAGTKGHGGEIFVFDMGQPVKIIDLAKRMIALSGAKNIGIKITGLRPGEKLYEEVLNKEEGTKPSFHDKIRIAEVRQYDYEEVNRKIEELTEIAMVFDNMATVKKMKEMVPEYKSNNSIYEVLD